MTHPSGPMITQFIYSTPTTRHPDNAAVPLVAGTTLAHGAVCSIGLSGRVWPDYVAGAPMGITDRAYAPGEAVTLYMQVTVTARPIRPRFVAAP